MSKQGLTWTALPSTTITAAVNATATDWVVVPAGANSATIAGIFTYGSGGTNATAYLQTSFDAGTTAMDVAALQFTTATANKVLHVTSATAVTSSVTTTDGSLTANTSVSGILGTHFRVKWVTTGTYAGGTTLKVICAVKA